MTADTWTAVAHCKLNLPVDCFAHTVFQERRTSSSVRPLLPVAPSSSRVSTDSTKLTSFLKGSAVNDTWWSTCAFSTSKQHGNVDSWQQRQIGLQHDKRNLALVSCACWWTQSAALSAQAWRTQETL